MPKARPARKVSLTIRIDEDVLKRVELFASVNRDKKSLVMQRALIAYLDSLKAPWPEEPKYLGED